MNKVAKPIKIFNVQQLACKIALNNFAINILSDNYTNKFKFSLTQRLKLIK